MSPRQGDQNFSCTLHVQYIKVGALIGVATVKKLETKPQFTHGKPLLFSFSTSVHNAT
jgi:hypothetical protein